MSVIIQVHSHRERSRFFGSLGRKPQSFYTLGDFDGTSFDGRSDLYEITEEEWQEKILPAKNPKWGRKLGVTRARVNRDDLRSCMA